MELPKFILFVFLTLIVSNMVMAEAEDFEADDTEEERSLLNKITIVPCNYAQSKPTHRTCASCNEAIQCKKNNQGLKQTCRGEYKYCNEGLCSNKPSRACAHRDK